MWLINARTYELEQHPSPNRDASTLQHYTHRSHEDPTIKYVNYSILSHRWTDDEPTFKDLYGQHDHDMQNAIRSKPRFEKMYAACQKSVQEGIDYIWIDTCCINKDSDAELSESINSMYGWYENAEMCLIYLHDHENGVYDTFHKGYDGRSKWFTRGWTLQELVAPRRALFYDRDWEYLGDKTSLAPQLAVASKVPESLLAGEQIFGISEYSVAQRMSWAVDRVTTRPEDVAYSLLGLFQVNMPLLYGEGALRAFRRLQEEIIRTNFDHSIFAWCREKELSNVGMLALTPDAFRHSASIVCRDAEQAKTPYSLTNLGVSITLPMKSIAGSKIHLARLDCRDTRSDAATWIGIYLVELDTKTWYRVSMDRQDLVSCYAKLEDYGDIAVSVPLAGSNHRSPLLSTGTFLYCNDNLSFEISEDLLRESKSGTHVDIELDENAALDHYTRYVCRRHVSSQSECLLSIGIDSQTLKIGALHLCFDAQSRPFVIADQSKGKVLKYEPSVLHRVSRGIKQGESVVYRHPSRPYLWTARGDDTYGQIDARLFMSGVTGPEHDARLQVLRRDHYWEVNLVEGQFRSISLDTETNRA